METPAKKTLVFKLVTAVEKHAGIVLAIIAILTIAIIGLYIYYHGVWMFGPYHHKKQKISNKKNEEPSEVDHLMNDINNYHGN